MHNFTDPFRRAIPRIYHIEQYLNEIFQVEQVASDTSVLSFIEDVYSKEMNHILDPQRDMESHYEVMKASFNSELIVREYINNGNTSSLILSEN